MGSVVRHRALPPWFVEARFGWPGWPSLDDALVRREIEALEWTAYVDGQYVALEKYALPLVEAARADAVLHAADDARRRAMPIAMEPDITATRRLARP